MKKLFTFLLGVCLCTLVMAERPTGVVQKADDTTKPVIDGQIDDLWENVTKFNIDKPFQAEVPTFGDEGTTYWKMLWDEAGVYILVVANDDAWFPFWAPGGGANGWEYDKVELYFDTNYILADGVGGQGGASGNRQIAPDSKSSAIAGEPQTQTILGGDVTWAINVTDPTWTSEYFVPWESIPDKDGILFDKTAQMGFDVTLIDRDPGDAARKRAQWANIGAINENWNNMDDAGYLTFEGAEAGIYVDGISISGGEITADNGTFQLVGVVSPADATNQKLKWNITGGTGKAKISADGLITAIKDGTITVKAVATDGGWAESNEATVTISGQVTTLPEVSLVTDGFFDDPTRAAWSGGTVVDGVLVCDPPSAGANPWDWTTTQIVDVPFAKKDIPYIFTFKAWSDAVRTFNVDFEDSNNGYSRYGVSTDPESNGTSDWTFDVTTEPKVYVFHVTFSNMMENARKSMQFMLGKADEPVYLDSVMVFEESEYILSNKLVNANTVRVYPNPVGSANQLNVNLPAAVGKVAIYNALGQKLIEKAATTTLVKFDVSSLRKGMYFVRLSDGTTQKFIR